MNKTQIASLALMAIALFSIYEGYQTLNQPVSTAPYAPSPLGITLLWENGVFMMLLFSFIVFTLSFYIFWQSQRRSKK
jgi:formate hydrogenlyase subunit 3/multisubunit Na+/H+ antiporter MnhD subunit